MARAVLSRSVDHAALRLKTLGAGTGVTRVLLGSGMKREEIELEDRSRSVDARQAAAPHELREFEFDHEAPMKSDTTSSRHE